MSRLIALRFVMFRSRYPLYGRHLPFVPCVFSIIENMLNGPASFISVALPKLDSPWVETTIRSSSP